MIEVLYTPAVKRRNQWVIEWRLRICFQAAMAVVYADIGRLLAEYPCVTVTQHMGVTASCQFSGGRDVARTFALVAERPGGGHLTGRISLLASL